LDLDDVLGKRLGMVGEDASRAEAAAANSWAKLKAAGRVTKRPHVTVVHRNSLPGEAEVWKQCGALHALGEPPMFKAKLGNLVWNGRVMAVTVEALEVVAGGEGGGRGVKLGRELLDTLEEVVKERLHITVGTMSQSVPAVEGKDLIEAFKKQEFTPGEGEGFLGLDGFLVQGRIKGLMA